ncbi:zinc-dependent metalloprotease [Bowmanella dokdonensis]|uniref:Zinc-dependent metalloprotease n=2 Tax=Bowmanella dokdonensis TaxID=751969 RepID=A0A939IL45_9ALTE|nr:zinc-dependent metalloprotease [Bowmanella dokdonensis]
MQYRDGYFDFYYQSEEDKLYLLVDKLDQPFIFQSSLPRGMGSNDIGLDRGQLGETRLVQFERFGNKVFLKQLNSYYRAASDNPAEQASVDEAFASSVLAGLPVVASDGNRLLVDYTEFLFSDIHQIAERLTQTNQGSYKADAKRSGIFLERSKAFPRNTELEALITFAGSKAGDHVKQVAPAPDAISVHLHHSLIALPEEGYQPRAFHPYSGYWKVEYMDYAAPIDQSMVKRFVPRHRLQKQDPGASVSEPVEPIVYYLDPGVPEPVRSALYDGAMWWNNAFEKLGYKNAFVVKPLPADADPMDVRYNVIQWVHRATRGWSYGSTVTDPRTGEILKGHVTLGSLRVRQDFLIATGLTSPYDGGANDTQTQLDMALARIRQLSAHEVGHTLGLIHNFAASANDRASVMDYPHPLVTLENDKISLKNAYTEGLGKWDLYAIEYGYGEFGDDEQDALRKLVSQAKEQGLEYIADRDARPAGGVSARGHLWDNGADPVAELKRLLAVRRVALNNLGLASIPDQAPLSSLQETLVPIYLLHRYQVEAVAKLVGGLEYEYELKGDHPKPRGLKHVGADQQRRALESLLATLSPDVLTLPADLLTLIPPRAYGDTDGRESFQGRTGLAFDPISAAEAAANHTLSLLLHPQRLNRLAMATGELNIEQMLKKLLEKSFKQPASRGVESLIRQRTDYLVFYSLMQAMQNPDLAPVARAELLTSLTGLREWLEDHQEQAQYRLIARELHWYLESGQWQPKYTPLALPPGSPI